MLRKHKIGKDKEHKTSVYTHLYWLIEDKKIEPDVFFYFLKFFWPSFKKKGGYIFLEQSYSDNEFSRLIKENGNPEYWINLITVDDYFSNSSNEERQSTLLVEALTELWSTKLRKDFPDIGFTVHYFLNHECGDFGLTFYQNKSNESEVIIKKSNKIITPNVKENKVEQSPDGPRPGFPRIREPERWEIPKHK